MVTPVTTCGVSDRCSVTIEDLDRTQRRLVISTKTPNGTRGVTLDYAHARAVATTLLACVDSPAPEQPEPATSAEDGVQFGGMMKHQRTVIQCTEGFEVTLDLGPALATLGLGDRCGGREQTLNRRQATTLRDALTAFAKDGKGSADEPKPTAEVLSVHGSEMLIRCRAVAYHIYPAEPGGAICCVQTRKAAQELLLEWGRSVDDTYHATQAIEA